MKNNKECKIVQELLPNYIENLTSKDVNMFMEEHLKDCKECQENLKIMQEELEIEKKQIPEKEVKYLKKFNRKFKIILSLIVIVLIIFVSIIVRRMIIINNLKKNADAVVGKYSDNYYVEIQMICQGEYGYSECYNLGNNFMTEQNILEGIGNVRKITHYQNGNKKIRLIESDYGKFITDIDTPIKIEMMKFNENIWLSLLTDVKKVKVNGKDCYRVDIDGYEEYIDKETGLIIKKINKATNQTIDYYYEFGKVKDEDIQIPDTSSYVYTQQQ